MGKACVVAFAILLCSNCRNDDNSQSNNVVAIDTLAFLVPYDSIGVSVGDSSYMLGDIWATSYTDEGNIAILDKTYGGIRFYSDDGIHIEDFVPRGEGPGEFLSLDRMCFDSEGNLILASYYDRKVALYSSELEFINEIVFTSGRNGPVRLDAGNDSSFVLMNFITEGDSIGTEVALFKDDQVPEVVYRKRMVSFDEGINHQKFTGMVFATSDEGRVYIADLYTQNYLITCYSPQGESLFTFGDRNYEPVYKPDSLVEYQTEMALEQYIDHYGTSDGFNYEPSPLFYPITSIAVDSNERIWVRGDLNTDEARIFSSNGTYLYTVKGIFQNGQDADGYNFRVNPRGVLVDLRNPEEYPVVYQVNEIRDPDPRHNGWTTTSD